MALKKSLLIIYLILTTTIVLAQMEVIPQLGQRKYIYGFAYSPNGKYLATGSHDNSVLLWETATYTHQIFTNHSNVVLKLIFSPDSKYLVSMDGSFNFNVWDTQKKTLVNSLKYNNDDQNSDLYFVNDRLLAFVDNQGLKIWDITTDKVVNKLPLTGNSFALHPNKSEVMIIKASTSFTGGKMSFSSTLYYYSLANNAPLDINWLNAFGREWQYAQYSPSGKYIAVTDRNMYVHLFDLKSKRRIWQSTSKINRFQISDDEALLFGFSDPDLREPLLIIMDFLTGKEKEKLSNFTGFGLAYNHELKQLSGASPYLDAYYQLNIYDLATKRMIRSIKPDHNEFYRINWDQKRKRIDVDSKNGSFQWDLNLGKITNQNDIRDNIQMSVNHGNQENYRVESIVIDRNKQRIGFKVFNTKTNQLLFEKRLKGPKGEDLHIGGIVISPDQKKIYAVNPDILFVFELPTGRLITTKEFKNTSPSRIAISPDNKTLALGKFWLQTTDNKAKWYNPNYEIELLDTESLQTKAILEGHMGMVTALSFTDDQKYLISASIDGSIRIWDYKNGKQKALLLGAKDDEYFIAENGGFYSASKRALDKVAFMDNMGNLYPAKVFELQLNRPDKVATSLGYADERINKALESAYQKRLQQLGIDEQKLSLIELPEIKIDGLPNQVANDKSLKLSYEATDPKAKLSHIKVNINQVPVYGANGLQIKGKNKAKGKFELHLNDGLNAIEIVVVNENGMSSIPVNYEVFCRTTTKPDLYLITIGIDQFMDQSYNLDFAAKDAQDVAALFKQQSADYNKIHHSHFSGIQATKENILSVADKLKQSKTDDQVVIFVATHGLFDDQFDYYLATYNTIFDKPSFNSLAYKDLEKMLDGIAARQKLILIDACHSGEVDQSEMQVGTTSVAALPDIKTRGFKKVESSTVGLENSFELMKNLFADLREGTGATVISSAGGAEFALESSEWSNGVFTYALLNGVKSKSADLNKDTQITISELQQYVFEEVKRLTNGKQNPTARVENIANDYALFSTVAGKEAAINFVGKWKAQERWDTTNKKWVQVNNPPYTDIEITRGADGFYYMSYGRGGIQLQMQAINEYKTVQGENISVKSGTELIKSSSHDTYRYKKQN